MSVGSISANNLLAPLFAKPLAWRVLDGIISVVMIAIALSLLLVR